MVKKIMQMAIAAILLSIALLLDQITVVSSQYVIILVAAACLTTISILLATSCVVEHKKTLWASIVCWLIIAGNTFVVADAIPRLFYCFCTNK